MIWTPPPRAGTDAWELTDYNQEMENATRRVNGLHHITAICGPAQKNLDFHAGVLGMRLV
jgi:hypothetical protein